MEEVVYGHKKWVSYLSRTATTLYPCVLPALGSFEGSWSYKTYPAAKVGIFCEIATLTRGGEW